ncbi:MAG: DMT family transporter [Pseudomonadota bacterium]
MLPEAEIRLFILTAITMVAFASNSILNRLALLEDTIGPGAFAAIRVASGVLVLFALLALKDRALPALTRPKPAAVFGLTAYMLGFSFAYVSMDAGIGALILFGGVQVTMFAGSVVEGDRPPVQRWIGMLISMSGLAVLTLPNEAISMPWSAAGLMALAALGWGIYSLMGRSASDPIAATAWNFLGCLPLVLLTLVAVPDVTEASLFGVLLAVASGGITSALGYALWYALLQSLGATRAALSQLSATAIAIGLGALFLGESVTLVALLASGLILGGIAIGLLPNTKKAS